MTPPLFVAVGETAEYSRTITATDIAAFAALSGDDDPVHVDEAFAHGTIFGRTIAHGAHVMSLLSTTASVISRRSVARGAKGTPVSAGYERIRFLRPVLAGDTLTARYVIEEVDAARTRTRARLEVVNQDGETCLAGTHLMAWAGAPGA